MAGDGMSSIAIGTDGFPVVSYYDDVTFDLKVIHCTNVPCTATDPLVILDSTGDVGQYNSIAIGTDGFPVVSYYDVSGNLKVAHCKDTACSPLPPDINTLDSGVTVGMYTSIAIGTDGFPIVSYHEGGSQDLKVVHCTDQACANPVDPPTVLDTTLLSVNHTSIAIGSDGFPVISYYDSNTLDLNLVHCEDKKCSIGNFTIIPLVTTDNVGQYSSIAIGTDGYPIVSYYNVTNSTPQVVHCKDVSCSTVDTPTILDGTETGGSHTSIAIGNDGYPVVSYYHVSQDDIRVVHCTNVSCSFFDPAITLDSPGSAGSHTSIAIGSDGYPVVSYFDAGDYKLVRATALYCGGGDTTPPTVTPPFIPADNATGVSVTANLVLTFDENIQKGPSGNITIKKTSDNTPLQTIAVTAAAVSISGMDVTINPPSDLPASTDVYVFIDAGAIEDLASNAYAGLSDKTIWNFITAAACVPENSPATCNDTVDNDCDSLIDCLDPDCNGIGSCEFFGELTCDDGIDNDGDGGIDCDDTNDDCDQEECGAPGWLCVSQICEEGS